MTSSPPRPRGQPSILTRGFAMPPWGQRRLGPQIRARWLVFLAVLAVPAPAAGPAAALDRAERRIVASVDRHVPAALELLERAVNVNSGTMNFDGVRETGRLFRAEWDALGFETRWVDGSAFQRAGHLFATRAGRRPALRVLLIGHLDTVFETDSPFQRWTRIDDSTASGPGSTDMKGGDVVMLLAIRALREAGLLDRLDVTVALMGDEEKVGSPRELARRELIEAARGADVAIGFEDGNGDPRDAVVARRGATGWVLRTSGRPYHSSQVFREDVGHGAIFEAARILAAFRDSLGHEEYLTLNPGAIVGGTQIAFDREAARGTAYGKNNVVAESTLVTGDLRALSIPQRERAKAAMRRIVADTTRAAGAAIAFDDGYPPLAPSEGNRKLLAFFERASLDLGYGPVGADDPARAGAADISFTEGIVGMALDGVGLMGTGGHTVRETADLRTLGMQAKRVAVTLARLAEGRR